MGTHSPGNLCLTPSDERPQKDARLRAVSLRYGITSDLDGKGITTAHAVGEAVGMSSDAAASLLNRKQLLKGDLEQLQIVAARLGLEL